MPRPFVADHITAHEGMNHIVEVDCIPEHIAEFVSTMHQLRTQLVCDMTMSIVMCPENHDNKNYVVIIGTRIEKAHNSVICQLTLNGYEEGMYTVWDRS